MLWTVVGHKWAVRQLQEALTRGALPQALLITGPESVGKQTLALAAVRTLFCQAPNGEKPCGKCLACHKLESGNYPDFLLVAPEEEGRPLKIEQIRDLERFLALTPNESPYKVALIQDFERATVSAANALLKTLEEPPSYAHLILLATDADLLLPTIVSRSQQVNLRPVPTPEIKQALQEGWQLPPETAERLARLSGGRVGWAVRAATELEYLQRMEEAIDTLLELLAADLPARFETAAMLAKDSVALSETLEYWLTAWRDVLLLQAEITEQVVHREYRPQLENIARRTPTMECVQVIKELEKAKLALAQNANTQLLVENLLLHLPEV